MAKFTLFTILTAVLATGQADAFNFRFYANSNCDHNAPAGSTSPPNNAPASSGGAGSCYNAPTGVNWQRVEIDNPPNAVITYCDINCQGGGSTLQNGHCFVPVPGCAVGSFKVI